MRLSEGEPVSAFAVLSRVIAEQRHKHPEDDEQAVLERFASGEVVLRDGSPLAPDTPITPGTDVFFYRRPAPETPVPFTIDTIYEDDSLLVVSKPPFLATMPRAAHITESATVRLRRATGNEELTPAHRLDRMTSGLLLFTKRASLRGAYQELFARRQVRKRYEAIAEYRGISAPARWEHHISKRHGEVAAAIIADAAPNALTNLLEVSLIDAPEMQKTHHTQQPIARYLLEPVTGRTHQLRVQMNAAGAPILGDPIYPAVSPFGEEDFTVPMRLASVYLGFPDPISGELREFSGPGFSAGCVSI
ncbi:pseudouridine synthase [Corynebacterium qintianiae]|uniref:pseudouridine synthase n=1 Tax=Corynebacterium qintianiae TaxID=2709392 RepID=UPI0039A4FDE0